MVPGARVCPVAGSAALIRRVVSIVLYILGGWLLSSAVFVALLNFGQSTATTIAVLAFFAVLSLPFLLLGLWASPGNRPAELGATLIVTAIVGAFLSLTMVVMISDPQFKQFMPADRPMPDFHFTPLPALVSLALIGGIGWLLSRRSKTASR